MRITIPPLDIGENDGFTNDRLGRKEFGESLLSLIDKTKEELVISLDAQWGEGKTTFVKMWRGLLSENGGQSVYIDAFANDYIDDPFVAIVSEIVSWAEKQTKPGKERLNAFKEKAYRVGAQILPLAAKLGVKAVTLNVVKDSDIEALKGIAAEIAKGTSEFASDLIRERIDSHKKDVETIESFREDLKRLSNDINKESGKPLVVIIDELDRCKPTYALQLIEIVKHLFLVENVVFVLVMNKKQLEEAVRCLYGRDIDAASYLQKFISVECRLPKDMESHSDDFQKYVNRLYELHELDLGRGKKGFLDVMTLLAKHYNLSLRKMEKCFTYASLCFASLPESHLVQPFLLALLAVMKVEKPDVYDRLRTGAISYDEFSIEAGLPLDKQDKWKWVSKWLMYFLSETIDEELERMTKELSFISSRERLGFIPYYCRTMDRMKTERT